MDNDNNKNNKSGDDLYAEYIKKYLPDDKEASAGSEELDDFIDRLRDGSDLDDMSAGEETGPGTSFRESEAEREPVPPVDNADVVLTSQGDTAVFTAGDVAEKPAATKKKSEKKNLGDLISGLGKKKSGTKKPARKKLEITDDKGTVWARILRVAVYVLCALALVFCVVVIAAAMYLSKVTVNDDVRLDLNSLELGQATRIMVMDPETEEWYEYTRVFGEENRVWISYEEFPQVLIDATVASEDERFWNHSGVDVKRTIGAFINEYVFPIWGNTQGGSTITQQLIKNILEEDESEGSSGALRKLREIYRAYQLERRFTKEQILEAYLNTFRLSGQVAGIEAAAKYYFNASTQDLTAAQAAAIVCITKFPGAHNPFVYPEENKIQREYVLRKMYELGSLTEAEYQAALAESATFVFDTPGDTSVNSGEITSYFTDLVFEEVLADLQEYSNLTEAQAADLFYNGGLVIYTTMHPDIQRIVETVAADADEENRRFPALQYIETEAQLEEELSWPGAPSDLQIGDPKFNQIQGAIVVMNYSGEILGVAGGIREKTVSRGTNRANRPRQTGSAMKPLAVYAPGIEFNQIHYSTWFMDVAAGVMNNRPWPDNYNNRYGAYGAGVTVYEGVCVSLNTTAVFALQRIGVDVSFDFLRTNLGITTLVERRAGGPGGKDWTDIDYAPLALGSLTDGISPIEMAAAYAVFGNDGTYTEPHCYSLITDSFSQVILDKKSVLMSNKAISDETAVIMNRLLQGVMISGTGTQARPRDGLDYAGKTGTTSDNYDIWMCGMNPYYVCVTWMGYDYNKRTTWATPRPTQTAFRAVMSQISEELELEPMSFPTSNGVSTARFCLGSGNLASAECPETAIGYYKDGNMPTETCVHSTVLPDPPQE